MNSLTDEEIEAAKSSTDYNLDAQLHEHNDCIRIAYEWLDAQKKIKTIPKFGVTSKHLIESWAGRYISQSDVSVAAELHPEVFGKYPRFNISKMLVEPSTSRLEDIAESFKHSNYRETHRPKRYKSQE
ncbi:hypothetical protein [Marinimicrobium sp. C2-29]|uniref:hypothetical protein n=1 Tax=Marinimicrobium sp. C2-29 TaxID=3139825 RepID=UPI003139F0E7